MTFNDVTFDVPSHVAVCPECGADLILEVVEWEDDTKHPTQGGCLVSCRLDSVNDESGEPHQMFQSDWAHIDWCVFEWASKNVQVNDEIEVRKVNAPQNK
jgi:hypothetical protein